MPGFAHRRAVALLVAGAIVLAGCPDDGGKSSKPRKPNRADETGQVPRLQLELVGSTVETTGPDAMAFPADLSDTVSGVVTDYVTDAVLAPMATGKGGEVAAIFTGPAAARIATGSPDRAVLFEEQLGKTTKPLVVKTAKLRFTGWADPFGGMQVVAATLVLEVTSSTDEGAVRVVRVGELAFLPADGSWKIGGYDLAVSRSGEGLGPEPTTTRAAT